LYEEVIGDLADRGTTVFLATHDLAGVERLADRVAILDDGRLLLDRPLEQLKAEWSLRLGDDCTLENIFVDVLRKGAAS
jgi:ABC-2 type transport system ATP-binding protein